MVCSPLSIQVVCMFTSVHPSCADHDSSRVKGFRPGSVAVFPKFKVHNPPQHPCVGSPPYDFGRWITQRRSLLILCQWTLGRRVSPPQATFQTSGHIYKAALNQVDFKTKAEEARVQVNSWAEK